MLGPFRVYQIVLIIIAIITLAFIYNRFRSKKTTPATFAVWIVAWIVILFFAFNPNTSDPLAGYFGFGRGIDLLLIIGLLLSLYMNFRLYIKFDDLNQQIKETEKKLNDEQEALAELLVNMHFEGDAEPITILAGSKSISDYAEKQAREDVAKQEIAAASERVKQLKENLNTQKTEAEIALKSSEDKRALVVSKQSSQRELQEQYNKSADDASALASYWEEQVKALAWTPPSNSTGNGSRTWGANNSYPYRYNCPGDNVRYSAYGGAVCQCTSYASYKAYEKWGISNTWGGHAYNYVNAVGYTVPSTGVKTYVDKNPAANTIAIQLGGAYGHVMWVEGVNADGSINVTEYNVNWPSIGCYLGDFCSRNHVGSAGTYFLHFD